jgi:hypothetical protein
MSVVDGGLVLGISLVAWYLGTRAGKWLAGWRNRRKVAELYRLVNEYRRLSSVVK